MIKQRINLGFIYYQIVAVITFLLLFVAGCGPTLSTQEQIVAFENAGPIESKVNVNSLTNTVQNAGQYQVVSGDILEFQMSTELRVISSDFTKWIRTSYAYKDVEPYLSRITKDGSITLPIVGQIPVAGKTLAQVESSVLDAYYPKYVVNPPMVVCEVKKYRGENKRVLTVLGLVNKPGAFPYPPDVQYNLMEALAFAGGLDMVADPRYLKIYRQDASGKIASVSLKVDNKTMEQAYNIMIKPGDVLYVSHTPRTRINRFLSDVFHITVGADARYPGY